MQLQDWLLHLIRPLGGIVFAIEELTKTHISYFRTALFTAVIIAGLTAQGLFGPYLYLGYPVIKGLSVYIFLGVILVAMLAGLGGSLSGRLMLALINLRTRLKNQNQKIIFVLVCGLVVASLGFVTRHRNDRFGKNNYDSGSIHF